MLVVTAGGNRMDGADWVRPVSASPKRRKLKRDEGQLRGLRVAVALRCSCSPQRSVARQKGVWRRDWFRGERAKIAALSSCPSTTSHRPSFRLRDPAAVMNHGGECERRSNVWFAQTRPGRWLRSGVEV